MRSTQRKLLKVNRDKSFLLDRLLQYEKVDASFSESDETESSDEEITRLDTSKRCLKTFLLKVTVIIYVLIFFFFVSRKKIEMGISNHTPHHIPTMTKSQLNTSKKKKPAPKVTKSNSTPIVSKNM